MSTSTHDSRLLHLRFPTERDEIKEVDLTLTRIADDIDEVDIDGSAIGYIRRVGRIFVALSGRRLDHATECAQSLLWDEAAWTLLEESDARQSLSTRFSSVPADRFRQAKSVLVG